MLTPQQITEKAEAKYPQSLLMGDRFSAIQDKRRQAYIAAYQECQKEMSKEWVSVEDVSSILSSNHSHHIMIESIKSLIYPCPQMCDKWININDKRPIDGGRYWCYIEESTETGFSNFQWNCYYDPIDNEFRDDHERMTVTHWMPLPAPPTSQP